MTKAKTRAERRRGRRKARSATITLPGGELAVQRPSQGQRGPKESPDQVALAARARQTGLPEADCRSQMMGCAVGQRLAVEHIADRAELWQAVCHLRRVWIAHDRAIGAPSRHPNIARMMQPSGAWSATVDDRSPEDVARAATRAYMLARGWLGMASRPAESACIRAVIDEPDGPVANWSLVIEALRSVAKGLKGDHRIAA